MIPLKQFKVRTKLIAGFMAVAAIGAIIGVTAIIRASEINELAGLMYEREIAGLSHASEANIQLVGAGRAIRSAVLAPSEEERRKHITSVQMRLQATHDELVSAGKFFASDEGKSRV